MKIASSEEVQVGYCLHLAAETDHRMKLAPETLGTIRPSLNLVRLMRFGFG